MSDGVRVSGITKRFGSLTAVDDVSLDIEKGEFFSLLGPSGCGKTTLLRIIAGFETPDAGQVFIGGTDVTLEAPQKRPTAMVFQNYALFPNMTVGENVAYGLRVRKLAPGDRTRRLRASLQRVDLSGMERKPVVELSGGQQQRVALARALAVEPDVLMFDEPLSNLDVALREQTRTELKTLHRQLETTSIYVTHDQTEALVLSDRIGVMRNGALVEVGPPRLLYEQPGSAFVATFLGDWNVIHDAETAIRLCGEAPRNAGAIAVKPVDIEAVNDTGDGLDAQLIARNFLGLHTEWILNVGPMQIKMLSAPDASFDGPIRIRARQFRHVSA